MDQRVCMIMVGAHDLAKLRKFYEQGLGWKVWGHVTPISIAYSVGHTVLVFLDSDYLAKERGEPIARGTNASLAVFVPTKDEASAVFAHAVAAGGKETSPFKLRDGGLYSGYFADPEGNSWEVVWSPDMPLDATGALTLPAN